MKERQELHCHNCDGYVRFDVDLETDGNYVLTCPNCGHKHYRLVLNGKITDMRWGQDPSQNQVIQVTNVTFSTTSTSVLYSNSANASTGSTGTYMNNLWLQTTTTN